MVLQVIDGLVAMNNYSINTNTIYSNSRTNWKTDQVPDEMLLNKSKLF